MAIDDMIDNVCRKSGFETKQTIIFCKLCENTTDKTKIYKAYKKIMKK